MTYNADVPMHAGGLTFYWGTSEWPATMIAEAREICARFGMEPPAVEQTSYSMLLRNRVEQELLPLYPGGLGLSVYSPLAGGALTGAKPELAMEAGATATIESLQKIAARLRLPGSNRPCSLPQLALAWTLSNQNVSTVIFGASSLEQLADNLGALDALPLLTDPAATVTLEVEEVLVNFCEMIVCLLVPCR